MQTFVDITVAQNKLERSRNKSAFFGSRFSKAFSRGGENIVKNYAVLFICRSLFATTAWSQTPGEVTRSASADRVPPVFRVRP